MAITNLDLGTAEYFEFSTGGKVYKFRHLNTREMAEFRSVIEKNKDATQEDGEAQLINFLFGFISSDDKTAPEFTQVWDTMITPRRNNFLKLVLEQFGAPAK